LLLDLPYFKVSGVSLNNAGSIGRLVRRLIGCLIALKMLGEAALVEAVLIGFDGDTFLDLLVSVRTELLDFLDVVLMLSLSRLTPILLNIHVV
jgi:hypothetical protein